MCTLIVFWQVHAQAPLVFGLNRDEFLERPSEDFAVRDEGGVRIFAGRDVESGGAWCALGPRVVAAVTNHRGGRSPRPGARSRGHLVTRAAAAESADAAVEAALVGDGDDYGPFHLFVADRAEARWVTNANGPFETTPVGPGLHVLGNFGLDHADDRVVSRLRAALAPAARDLAETGDGAATVATLQDALRGHGDGWPCVHLGPYGTRSSARVQYFGAMPTLSTTWGPSCTRTWTDRSALLASLAEGA